MVGWSGGTGSDRCVSRVFLSDRLVKGGLFEISV